jgi:ATP-dependent helicase/nuclease subunit B
VSLFFTQRPISVCPNERQALALWEADAKKHRAQDEKAWETLPACSWVEFLRALHEEYWLAGRPAGSPLSLMNEWQERFLWIKVVSESDAGNGLLNLPAAARLAADAWKLANSYGLMSALQQSHAYWPEETQVFLGWVTAFQSACLDRGWLAIGRLESELTSVLKAGGLPTEALPSKVTFVGFAEWTPAAKALLEALREQGVQIVEAGSPEQTERHWRRLPCAHAEDEIRTAGLWLRHQLENSNEPNLRVGLVLPNLGARRVEVHRLLNEVFLPSNLTSPRNDLSQVCDFSIGLPLGRFQIVKSALELLSWDGSSQRLEDWKALLSPFLGEAETELHKRSLLFRKLQSDGRFQVSLKRILQLSQATERPYQCPLLQKRLSAVQSFLHETPRLQSPSAWASHFSDILELFGWPGERQLNSPEYQTVTRWKSTLSGLGSLDGLLGSVTRGQALSTLRRIADETVYQPKLSHGGLEVMGTLEAVGLQFDRLWVAGLEDTTWPAPSRPNPYLPYHLQKEHGVAHSTPDRELEFARLITEKLLRAARYGVASYPTQSQEQACRPSPLLRDLPLISSDELKLESGHSVHRLFLQSSAMEIVPDPGPPMVDADEKNRGGTSLFKHQSACPFRAYAYLRLHARPADIPEEGLDARERGIMIHSALEKIWDRVKTLERWQAAGTEDRRLWLRESAETAVESMRWKRPDVLKGVMVKLEKDRLLGLLHEWMELESTRDPFQVLATEERVTLDFAGLKLRATVDRIDRLSDGSLAVIDYKTGSPKVGDWLGERPKEPQLPLYSVSHPRAVETICFALLKPGKMSFQGLGAKDESLPGVKASEYADDGYRTWAERKAEWSARLEGLAEEFRTGHAIVDPIEGKKTCRFCGLEPLCRVDEREEQND